MSGRLPAPTRRSTCRFAKLIPTGRGKLVDVSAASPERAISFGPFRLVPTQRLLLEDDNPVRVGSRALDILTALVERPGELVGKHELMARVWRGTFVEEGNLKFQVGALRRALGDGRGGRRYIATSAGQGYRFVAPVSVAQAPAAAALPAAPTRQNHNLPQQLTRLIGRADAVSRIVARLQRHRLLSIVGPGGIGKTSVAIAVAEASVNTYEHGVWFVDLAPLADARLVPSAVAQVLGFDIRSDDPVPGLVGALRDRRLVLVLDNCEHVIEAAATLAVAILRGAADVHILATSREPLRVEGEYVQRLPPLSSGFPSDHLGAAEALAFPAVELFVERAAERLGEFELTDENAPIVAEICLKLDGIPLAIELAAARVETFGVRGLATHLDDRFRLLTSGRRSGPPRHRTLRAALDWSYDVLSEPERAVLRRLGIFMGGFTLDAACAVVADPGLLKGDVIDAVAELVEKSLAVVETTETEPRLRLLETTRAYALERLAESGEWEAVAHRHADPGLLKGNVIHAIAELVEKSLAVVEKTETEPRLRMLETTRAYALQRLGESGEWEAVAHRHAEYATAGEAVAPGDRNREFARLGGLRGSCRPRPERLPPAPRHLDQCRRRRAAPRPEA